MSRHHAVSLHTKLLEQIKGYGRDPPKLVRYIANNTNEQAVPEQLLDRDKLLEQIKGNLLKAQQIMKNQADKNRRGHLAVGDEVLVKLQPYRQHSEAIKKCQKLSML